MTKTPSHQNKQWTPQQDATLKKLAAGNTPTGLIAYELGRSESAIYGRASDIGVSLKPTNKSPYNSRKKR
jgi:hypothetical protein